MRYTGLDVNIALTAICNLSIIIPVGHGIAPTGLMEYLVLFTDSYSIQFSVGDYESVIGIAAVFSFSGQAMMLISFAVKKQITVARILLVGLSLLYIGLFILTCRSFIGDSRAIVSLVTGIPFVIASVIMIKKLFSFVSEEQ